MKKSSEINEANYEDGTVNNGHLYQYLNDEQFENVLQNAKSLNITKVPVMPEKCFDDFLLTNSERYKCTDKKLFKNDIAHTLINSICKPKIIKTISLEFQNNYKYNST